MALRVAGRPGDLFEYIRDGTADVGNQIMSDIITFQPVDWIIVLIYGVVIFAVGFFVVRKPKDQGT